MLKKLLFSSLMKFGVELGLKSRTPKYIALNIFGMLLMALAVLFALITLHDFLSQTYTPLVANSLFALGFAGLGMLVLLIRAVLRKKAKQQSAPNRLAQGFEKITDEAKDYLNPALSQAKSASNQVKGALSSGNATYLIGAVIVGLLLGNRSRAKNKSSN